MNLLDRIQHAWNALKGANSYVDYGTSYSRPMHRRSAGYARAAITPPVFNRIALDVAHTTFQHVKINEKTDDREIIKSGLQNCLSIEANIDQSHIALLQDLVYSMFDEGVVAVVPVDTTLDPTISGAYDIITLRVGKILQWYPKFIKVRLYNEETGQEEELTLPKKMVAIIENPLYAVVNDENSTLTRLTNKMMQIDNIDDMYASGRLDLIFQLPHPLKTDAQQAAAKERIKTIEDQLAAGKHGIAYVDSTEKVTQINRPVNNQLLESIQDLSDRFFNELGLTANVFNGTANEEEMRNYYNRSIDPIAKAIAVEFSRKFLTKTARTQGQTIEFYRNAFITVSTEQIVKLGDTFRRNAILTSNEIRKIVGFRPNSDPRADDLYNPNMPDSMQGAAQSQETSKIEEIQNGEKKKKEEINEKTDRL